MDWLIWLFCITISTDAVSSYCKLHFIESHLNNLVYKQIQYNFSTQLKFNDYVVFFKRFVASIKIADSPCENLQHSTFLFHKIFATYMYEYFTTRVITYLSSHSCNVPKHWTRTHLPERMKLSPINILRPVSASLHTCGSW